MNIPEEHWQHAPVALPPIHLPRGLVNRLELDNGSGPTTAEWASAILAYVLERGLDALQVPESASEAHTITPDELADLRDKASRSAEYRSWWLMAEGQRKPR